MSSFNIKDISRDAAKKADESWGRAVGGNESHPDDRVVVGGGQARRREQFLRSLIKPGITTLVAATVFAAGSAAVFYDQAWNGLVKGYSASSNDYEQTEVTVGTGTDGAVQTHGVKYIELVDAGYVKVGGKIPRDGNWDLAGFTGKNGVNGVSDLDDPAILATVRKDVMAAKLDTLATSISIDWSIHQKKAESLGYDINDYIRVAANGSLDEARTWARSGFDAQFGRSFGVDIGPVEASPENASDLTANIFRKLQDVAPQEAAAEQRGDDVETGNNGPEVN